MCLSALLFARLAFGLDPVKLGEPSVRLEYLVPVDPQNRQYPGAIQKLLGKHWGEGTMIYTDSPYAGADFAVSVWGEDYQNYDYDHPTHNFITLLEVSPSGENATAVVRKELTIPIDSDFAIAVQRAWAAMLLNVRYPSGRYRTLDGSLTEFSVWVTGAGGVYGELSGTAKGLAKELQDIGNALANYCRASEHERRETRDSIVVRLRNFGQRASARRDRNIGQN